MRITQFEGLIPKMADKALPKEKAVRAENMDVYGNHLRPIRLPKLTGEKLLTPCGEVFTGTPVSVHRAGSVFIAWDTLTFTTVDWRKKLGETTFLFVQDGELYRQSAERVLAKQCPIKVGIHRPSMDAEITLEEVDRAGCPKTIIDNLCVPIDEECDNIEHPPVPVAYMFTYVNACDEESAHSKPSEVLDINWGDAVKITVKDTPPDNAVKRRWYRAVVDNEQVTHWLKVGESDIGQDFIYDQNCPCDFSCELSTENHEPPPDCLEGVASLGDNLTVLWSNHHFYVSENNFPHAYDPVNTYRLRYRIKGLYEVTDLVEGSVHYKLIAITDGLHYTIAADEPAEVHISELQQRYKCTNFAGVSKTEGEVIYPSKQGIVSISTGGESLLSGVFMTEHEWAEFDPSHIKLVYHDDRIFGFNDDGGFIMQIRSDKRRDAEFVTHNVRVDGGYTDETSLFYVFKGADIYEWGVGDRAIYDWQSQTYMLQGLWRPVAVKVISQEFDNIMPRGHREAKIKFDEWKRKYPTSCETDFFVEHKEYQQHYTHLVGHRPSVTIIIYADGREYYRRQVSTNKPFLLPRKHKAVDWSVRVIGSIPIDEIHIQTSREMLLGSD